MTGSVPTAAIFPEPSAARWQLLRAGLQNIWEYDDHRFVFHRGRLLLRGANESGKTKALEVLLPFLLDADLAPQRLDPFGSMSRPMRWNLINEDITGVDVSIGYVWLEFGRLAASTHEFCTIGAGLRAKRSHKDVDVWYFITPQRIDVDLHLLGDRRVPLIESRLEEAIGDAGKVFDRAADYRKKVNESLFRMPQEQYDTLIEALLQLRRPKLSERLDPDELSKILTASLPPLEPRIIGSLAEGFERLERHRVERKEFAGTVAAVKEFLGVYRRYLAVVAKATAQGLTVAESTYQRLRGLLRDREKAHADVLGEQNALGEEIARLENSEIVVRERLDAVRTSEAYKSIQELETIERAARKQAQYHQTALARWESDRDRLLALEAKLAQAKSQLTVQDRVVASRRSDAGGAAIEAALDREHRAIDALAAAENIPSAEGAVRSLLERRRTDIDSVAVEVRKAAAALIAAQKAEERLADATTRVAEAEAKVAEAEEAAEEAEDTFRDDARRWLESLDVLRPSPGAETDLLEIPVDDMQAVVESMAEPVRAGLDSEAAYLGTKLNEVTAEIDSAETERATLAATTHSPPPAPTWRSLRSEDRPGSPFFMLCDFKEQATLSRGPLEAALEASGLLDAWVTADGALLDATTFDVIWLPEPREGPTLADVLDPVEANGVDASAVNRILRTLPLVPEGASAPEWGSWVSADGRWRLGPLQGRWTKPEPTYIGTMAREQARARRLAELEALITTLRDRERRLRAEWSELQARRTTLQRELRRFPALTAVMEARAIVKAESASLVDERTQHQIVLTDCERKREDLREALAARNTRASAVGLLPWVDTLESLRERTSNYKVVIADLLALIRLTVAARSAASDLAREADDQRRRSSQSEEEAEQGRRDAIAMQTRAQTLLEALGATRDELLARISDDETELDGIRRRLRLRRSDKTTVDGRVGSAETEVRTASQNVETADGERRSAEQRFKNFASRGFLAVLDIRSDGIPSDWSLRDALIAARAVDAATESIAASQEARDAADTKVSQSHRDLEQILPHQVRVFGERSDGVLEYRTTLQGRPRSVLELMADLENEIIAHDRLLDEEEAKLFESFLTGETHQHLRARLREARKLVDGINVELEKRPTSSGMIMHLLWNPRDDAPTGVAQAIELLLRSGHLLTDIDRTALRSFLEQRLDEAHTADAAVTLEERMMTVLDYRLWFSFTVQVRSGGGQPWARLTRKRHAAGSGGQKGVMLQLPLFAAAAAFYESAAPTAPRLIMLDEAFSGIDRRMRGKLMGLLAQFELDFVMTSFEEWGFYEELDGLSTYHLCREQGMRGVYADWFIWDGKRATQMSS